MCEELYQMLLVFRSLRSVCQNRVWAVDVYKRQLLNTLIEKITVHEAVKGEDGSREQEVEIYYRFIGKID